ASPSSTNPRSSPPASNRTRPCPVTPSFAWSWARTREPHEARIASIRLHTHSRSRMWSDDHRALADVVHDADVTRPRAAHVEEHKCAGALVATRYAGGPQVRDTARRGVRDPRGPIRHHRRARAVKAVRPLRSVDVRLPKLSARVRDALPPPPRGQRPPA